MTIMTLKNGRFCARCGTRFAATRFPSPCQTCGTVEWNNPVPKVIGLVLHRNWLLLRATGEQVIDRLPATSLAENEHPYEALRRLVREDCGVEVQETKVVGFSPRLSPADGLPPPRPALDIFCYAAPVWSPVGTPHSRLGSIWLSLESVDPDAFQGEVRSFLMKHAASL
ncbi:MAG: hypothetical protein E6K80_08185 [Candidatus Eisenbacteria bacterium]|uniref:NUDIX domain-containing protein n=1 Tax=Eiseniibacteriota bacterium TaxID=2212470 RepID=A0A538U3R7_UNCEI|nr:MAG: hypothetical protein E6K80_08185 [Candidatus Eisenbacteria bacterium]